jgi:hypothetical protein
MVKEKQFNKRYKELWIASHNFSAPASAFPWPDTHAVASYCMLLEALKQLNELEDEIKGI